MAHKVSRGQWHNQERRFDGRLMAASWSTDCSKGMKASWSPCLVSVCRLSVCLAPPVHRRGLVALAPQNTSIPPKGGLPACRTMLQSENQRTSGTPSPVQRPLRHGAICEDSSGPVVGFPARLVGCCCHTSNSALCQHQLHAAMPLRLHTRRRLGRHVYKHVSARIIRPKKLWWNGVVVREHVFAPETCLPTLTICFPLRTGTNLHSPRPPIDTSMSAGACRSSQ